MVSPKPNNSKESTQEEISQVNPISEADILINNAPEVSSDVLPVIENPAASPTGTAPALVDSPQVKGKRGRKPGSKNKNRPVAPEIEQREETNIADDMKIPPEQLARGFNQAYETILCITLGDDGELTESERINLDKSLAVYMRVKNYDPPPGMALCMAYMAVTAAKIQKPKPKERFKMLWIGIKEKLGRKKKASVDNV